jgi:hypothetical protein
VEASEQPSRVARKVASIVAVPWEVLAGGPARFLRLEMAYACLDVSVCVDCAAIWHVHIGEQRMTCCERSAKFSA